MAEKKKEKQTVQTATKASQMSTYSVEEIAAASYKLMKVPKECVIAAFKVAGKTEATVAEAKTIVRNFMERKVL